MNSVRNFIYLDEHKLYSYSSQIFEGLTESIVNIKTTGRREDESGPIGTNSRQILANIFSEHSATHEKRFLFDHAYKLMEDKLISSGAVLDIDAHSGTEVDLGNHDFLRVRGRISFNDVRSTKNLIAKINSIGEAITYVTSHKAIAEEKKHTPDPKDRNKKIAREAAISSSLARLAEESGLRHDPKVLAHISTLLDFGFEDQFEIRMQFSELEYVPRSAFAAILKRDCLREPESMLLRKYGRKTEREFTLFGVVAQAENKTGDDAESSSLPNVAEIAGNLRSRLHQLVNHFVAMDDALSGRSVNEVYIDPIAVYLDVRAGTSNDD